MPLEQSIPRLAAAGFTVLDMNFYDWALPGTPFRTEHWGTWIRLVAAVAADNGVRFHQGHAYTFDYAKPMSADEYAQEQTLVQRSLECLAVLGTTVAVTHPATFRSANTTASSLQGNAEYLHQLADRAADLGIRIAVENMCDTSTGTRRRYFSTAEEIRGFFAEEEDTRIGLCWDFEHGHLMGLDARDVAAIFQEHGPRVIATQASDSLSHTNTDLMHVPPFFGGNPYWPEQMRALGSIGYRGCLSLETHNFTNWLPDELVDSGLRLCYEIAQQLISWGEEV